MSEIRNSRANGSYWQLRSPNLTLRIHTTGPKKSANQYPVNACNGT